MRVVHLLHHYPPEFRGGTEACVETLAAAQQARGDEVTIITGADARCGPDEDGALRREEVGGVPVRRLLRRPDENYSVDARLPRVAEQVLALVAEVDPDVVHLHHTLNLSADLASRLAASGRTVVATLHDFTLVCARFFLLRPDGGSCADAFPLPAERCFDCVLPDFPAGAEQLRHELRDKTAGVAGEAAALARAIAPSRFVAERWERSGLFGPGRLSVLPHAPALGAAAPPPPRDRADGRLRLLSWGHLAPAKGVHHLLGALAALADAGETRVELDLLGAATDPAYEAQLRAAAAGLTVRFHGRYEAEALRAQAASADLALFPSLAEETFGLVVAEARALGLPVVTSDRGALPEGVGGAGTTLPAGDEGALADLLRRLLDDGGATLDRWRAAASAERLDPTAHAERVAALYHEALAS